MWLMAATVLFVSLLMGRWRTWGVIPDFDTGFRGLSFLLRALMRLALSSWLMVLYLRSGLSTALTLVTPMELDLLMLEVGLESTTELQPKLTTFIVELGLEFIDLLGVFGLAQTTLFEKFGLAKTTLLEAFGLAHVTLFVEFGLAQITLLEDVGLEPMTLTVEFGLEQTTLTVEVGLDLTTLLLDSFLFKSLSMSLMSLSSLSLALSKENTDLVDSIP